MVDQDEVSNPSAPSGKSAKYARRELERRFLVSRQPDRAARRVVAITDHYLIGTRLRLRRSTERDTGATTFKLTQKVPHLGGGPGLITTIYLDRSEHDVLAALPAARLSKTRSSFPPFGVDVFEGELEGLVLAEVEFDAEEELRTFTPPSWVAAEVTRDARFNGGALVSTTSAEIRELTASLGVELPAAGGPAPLADDLGHCRPSAR